MPISFAINKGSLLPLFLISSFALKFYNDYKLFLNLSQEYSFLICSEAETPAQK